MRERRMQGSAHGRPASEATVDTDRVNLAQGEPGRDLNRFPRVDGTFPLNGSAPLEPNSLGAGIG